MFFNFKELINNLLFDHLHYTFRLEISLNRTAITAITSKI